MKTKSDSSINDLKTLNDWAGVRVMIMTPFSIQVTASADALEILTEPEPPISIPSLVMGDDFQFPIDPEGIRKTLEQIRDACDACPGSVIRRII